MTTAKEIESLYEALELDPHQSFDVKPNFVRTGEQINSLLNVTYPTAFGHQSISLSNSTDSI